MVINCPNPNKYRLPPPSNPLYIIHECSFWYIRNISIRSKRKHCRSRKAYFKHFKFRDIWNPISGGLRDEGPETCRPPPAPLGDIRWGHPPPHGFWYASFFVLNCMTFYDNMRKLSDKFRLKLIWGGTKCHQKCSPLLANLTLRPWRGVESEHNKPEVLKLVQSVLHLLPVHAQELDHLKVRNCRAM